MSKAVISKDDGNMPSKPKTAFLKHRSRSLDHGLQNMGLVEISEELNHNLEESLHKMPDLLSYKSRGEKKSSSKKKGLQKTASAAQLSGKKSKTAIPSRTSVPNLTKRGSTVEGIVGFSLDGRAGKVTFNRRTSSTSSSSLEDDDTFLTALTEDIPFVASTSESAVNKRNAFSNAKSDRVKFNVQSGVSLFNSEQSSLNSERLSAANISFSSAESFTSSHETQKAQKSHSLAPHRSRVVKKSEMTQEDKQIQKDLNRKIKKARNEKFHKLFRSIPNDEIVLKSYICAFVGDILLQGYLYISPNYFCFYTKILGHEKQLEIPILDVENITREKIAMFIPNAIGVITSKDKFVFGSLMARDRAYRHMMNSWKKVKSLAGQGEPDITRRRSKDAASDADSSLSECQSDDSSCISLDDVTPDETDTGSTPLQRSQSSQSTGDPDSPISNSPDVTTPAPAPQRLTEIPSPHYTPKQHGRSLSAPQAPNDVAAKIGRWAFTDMALMSSIGSILGGVLVSIQQIPTTKRLLALIVIAMMLMFSAAVMTRQIYFIQAQLDAKAALEQSDTSNYLHCETPSEDPFTVERLQTVMESNLQLLARVHKALSHSPSLVDQQCATENGD